MQGITVLDFFAIILSIVSLVITIIGFFASLKFYRDGVNLQNLANDALIRIEEKAQTLQTQVGGMFDKTLDAALGRGDLVKENFQAINDQLESATDLIVEAAKKQIGNIGNEEMRRLEGLVDEQMKLLRERVQDTKETVEELTETPSMPVTKYTTEGKIILLLRESKQPLRLKEISEILGISLATTVRALRSLVEAMVLKKETINHISVYSLNAGIER